LPEEPEICLYGRSDFLGLSSIFKFGHFQENHDSEYCYLPLKSKDLKSYDMQTIYAIMGTNRAVAGNGRYFAIFILTQMGKFDTLASSFSYL